VTLGGQYLFMGIAIILTEGKPQLGFPEFFQELGNGTVGGVVPIPLVFFVIVAVITYYILQKTPYGLKLYLIGANQRASRYSGLKVDGLLRKTYGAAGLMSAVAGFILIARTNQANADYGTSYTLQSIMIAVLGGTDPNGGAGTVSGVVMAVLTMQFISTGINTMGLSNVNFLRQLVWGIALIAVMAINYFSAARKAKKALQNT
jgi:simple sugar transport system permease protein